MPLHRPIAAAVLCLTSALALAADVIHRPVKPTAQAPTGTIGFSVSHMDRSVDPRQDFYAYANGNWLKRLKIPDAEKQRLLAMTPWSYVGKAAVLAKRI